MTLYGEREGAVRPVLQIAMPRWPRIYAPGGTMHVVARRNNREVNFTARGESEIGGRANVPSAAPSSSNVIIHQAGEKESSLYLRKFERLENKRCPVSPHCGSGEGAFLSSL